MTRLQIASLNRLLDLVRSLPSLKTECLAATESAKASQLSAQHDVACEEAEELLLSLLEEDQA